MPEHERPRSGRARGTSGLEYGKAISEHRWEKRLLEYAAWFAGPLAAEFLDRLAQMVLEDFGGIVGVLEYETPRMISAAGLRIDPHWQNLYMQHYHGLNPFLGTVERFRLENATADLQEWLPLHRLKQTEYFNDFMRPQGMQDVIATSVSLHDGARMSISIYRGTGTGGEFDPVELRRIEQLRPLARSAFAARRLAELLADNGRRPADFADMYQRLASQRRSEHAGSGNAAELLRDRYGLSTRQLQVALALLAGLSRKEIANQLSISSESVKTHIRALMDKTGTDSARKLIPLLARRSG